MFGLQTQRQIEAFLAQTGICQPEIGTPSLQFSFSGHQLYIEWRHHQLWMTVVVAAEIDDSQLLALFERIFSGLTTRYLLRPFRIKGGVALNVSVSDETTSEQLLLVYRTMLRLLAPWNKRIHP